MAACGAHYGTIFATCERADPQSKGGSEATVKIAKADLVPKDTNLLPQYGSWDELEGACRVFLDRVNTRPHRITRRPPLEMLQIERSSLNRLPEQPFTVAFGVTRRVSATASISYAGASYSVPHTLAEESVWVRTDGEQLIVTAALEQGLAQVARHRCAIPGSRVIDPDHYPAAPPGPLKRRPRPGTDNERKFLAIGANAERWLIGAAQAGSPRLAANLEEIVGLARLNGEGDVNRALGLAAEHQRFGFGDIAAILTSPAPGRLRRARPCSYITSGTAPWRGFGIWEEEA